VYGLAPMVSGVGYGSPLPTPLEVLDRGGGDTGLLLRFNAADLSGFNSANFNFALLDANGNHLYTGASQSNASLSQWNSLVAGTTLQNGEFIGRINLQPSAQQGLYSLQSFNLQDQSGNSVWFSPNWEWDEGTQRNIFGWSPEAAYYLGIDPASVSFQISGAWPAAGPIASPSPAYDVTLPVLTSIALSDSIIYRTGGENGFLIRVDAEDQSGLSNLNFTFRRLDTNGNPNGESVNAWLNPNGSLVLGGGPQQGSYVTGLELPGSIQAGSYLLNNINVSDEAGNSRSFWPTWTWDPALNIQRYEWSQETVDQLGFDPRSFGFEVIGESAFIPNSSIDRELPVLSNVRLDSTILDRSQGVLGTLLRFDVSDQTGFSNLNLGFRSNSTGSGAQTNVNVWVNEQNGLVTGTTSRNGDVVAALFLSSGLAEGSYELDYAQFSDRAGNQINLNRTSVWDPLTQSTSWVWTPEALAALGFDPSSIGFSVTGDYLAVDADYEAPRLSNLNLQASSAVEASSIATVTNNLQTLYLSVANPRLTEGPQGPAGPVPPAGNVGSGYGSPSIGRLVYRSPDGRQSKFVQIYDNDKIGVDQSSDLYAVDLGLTTADQPGLWTLTRLYLEGDDPLDVYRDSGFAVAGQNALTDPTLQVMAQRLGIPAEVLAFYFDNPDYGTPAPSSLPLFSGISISQSSDELVKAEISLDLSSLPVGFTAVNDFFVNLEVRSPDGRRYESVYLNSEDIVAISSDGVAYEAAFSLGQASKSGTWTLERLTIGSQESPEQSFTVSRQLFNFASWDAPTTELQVQQMAERLGLSPDALSFNLTNSSYVAQDDWAAPKVTSLSVSQPVNGNVLIDISLEDSGSGIGDGYVGSLGFVHQDGKAWRYVDITNDNRLSGDDGASVYQLQLQLDEASPPGDWILAELVVRDQLDNWYSINRQPGNNTPWDSPVSQLELDAFAAKLNLVSSDALVISYDNPSFVETVLTPRLLAMSFSALGGPVGPNALQLGYKLNQGISQLAVLGDSVLPESRYYLDITAESLLSGYGLESADVTLRFNPRLFNPIQASDIQISSAYSVANAVSIDNDLGTIRIAAAALADLIESPLANQNLFAKIALDFNEAALQTLEQNADGSFVSTPESPNPLGFEISVNRDETILSRVFVDADGQFNRSITSLNDLDLGFQVSGQDVLLYEAKINLAQRHDGLVLGTQRVIGADAAFTNLIRSGDTITATAEWLNVGNIEATNLAVTGRHNANAELVGATLSATSINSGTFVNGSFDSNGREQVSVAADIRITGRAGNVVDLADGILSVAAEGSVDFLNAGKGSSNLITFQGDLNYDGRVSMKDLAYLNAGAARQVLDEATGKATAASYARDVDADFNGVIDLADLAVLDADWGKSLHNGADDFLGSSDLSWDALDAQGADSSWNNDSFKDQNAVEAAANYVGSLESPTATGVIGADGNGTSNDGGIDGTYFEYPLAA